MITNDGSSSDLFAVPQPCACCCACKEACQSHKIRKSPTRLGLALTEHQFVVSSTHRVCAVLGGVLGDRLHELVVAAVVKRQDQVQPAWQVLCIQALIAHSCADGGTLLSDTAPTHRPPAYDKAKASCQTAYSG